MKKWSFILLCVWCLFSSVAALGKSCKMNDCSIPRMGCFYCYPSAFNFGASNGMMSGTSKKLRIMGIGDSITEGGNSFTSYLEPLGKLLREAHIDYEFVGPRIGRTPGMPYRCAAIGGKNVEYIEQYVDSMLCDFPVDVILLHSGHNHFIDEDPVPGMIQAYKAIIQKAKTCNPNVIVLVARVIESGKLPKYGYIPSFNKALCKMVDEMDDKNVRMVPVNKGFKWTKHTVVDKVHPNENGAKLMAHNWLKAILNIYKGKMN